MTLEATMVMLDNSAFSINGDYLPTRWESQVDAASILMQAKIQANGQSSVGLGLMAGKHV
jgi:26S proteasome regulatory subunit N10